MPINPPPYIISLSLSISQSLGPFLSLSHFSLSCFSLFLPAVFSPLPSLYLPSNVFPLLPSIFVFFSPSLSPRIYINRSLSLSLFLCLSVCLSACLSVCLSVCLSPPAVFSLSRPCYLFFLSPSPSYFSPFLMFSLSFPPAISYSPHFLSHSLSLTPGVSYQGPSKWFLFVYTQSHWSIFGYHLNGHSLPPILKFASSLASLVPFLFVFFFFYVCPSASLPSPSFQLYLKIFSFISHISLFIKSRRYLALLHKNQERQGMNKQQKKERERQTDRGKHEF